MREHEELLQLHIHMQRQAITDIAFYTCSMALILIYAQGNEARNAYN